MPRSMRAYLVVSDASLGAKMVDLKKPADSEREKQDTQDHLGNKTCREFFFGMQDSNVFCKSSYWVDCENEAAPALAAADYVTPEVTGLLSYDGKRSLTAAGLQVYLESFLMHFLMVLL